MPVLIQEHESVEKPEGHLRRFKPASGDQKQYRLVTEPADSPQTFRDACMGKIPDVALPILRVPRTYFAVDGHGFMLLPGYEKEDDSNASWQSLMRQVLSGCSGRIVVTDGSRLADARSLDITRDLQASHLEGDRPLVLITKTEELLSANAIDALDSLRGVAAKAFAVPEQDAAEMILCTGTGADVMDQWRVALKDMLPSVIQTSAKVRDRQLEHVHNLLNEELKPQLAAVRHALAMRGTDSGTDGETQCGEALKAFDGERKYLRDLYAKAVRDILKQQATEANDRLLNLLKSEQGFGKWSGSIGEKPAEADRKLLNTLKSAWGDPQKFHLAHATELGKLTAVQLGGPNTLIEGKLPEGGGAVARLGYQEKESWKQIDNSVITDLTVLFGRPPQNGSLVEGADDVGTTALRSVRLLPALTLEMARIAALFPAAFAVDPTTGKRLDGDPAKRIGEDFSALQGVSTNIIKGLALMLAVDFAADGTVQTIPALLGALGVAGPVATALAGIAGAAVVGAAVLREVNRHDRHVQTQAQRSLTLMGESVSAELLANFDALMEHVRRSLSDRLAVRYKLDETWTRRDRIAKALANVSSLRQDLQSQVAAGRFVLPGQA
ncbi:hypothetical protein [Cupriavidus laharis]|uniref:hypothetical protein n=1 Tax=Cupriavidus laharis TaxID=151654 RepID=UPI001CC426C5|nr:hypothetical protein [Cupriavidus laharis]